MLIFDLGHPFYVAEDGIKYAALHNRAEVETIKLVVHQFWIDGYKDFNFMRASAVVKRQSTFMAS